MARRLAPAAGRVVTAAALRPGMTVLDVGCGTGNAALEAARLGALATGADPTPELLAIAADRARQENLPVTWEEASADRVSGAYDRVLSVFGAMYAPDAEHAAAALVRCCAPGGRIVSAAWTPDGFMAATNRALGRFLPPPPAGAEPPTRWGDAPFVQRLFARQDVSDVTTTTERVRFRFASPTEAAEFWVRAAGHVQVERPRLEAEGRWTALHHEVAAVFSEWNLDAGPGVCVDSAYLLVTATRG